MRRCIQSQILCQLPHVVFPLLSIRPVQRGRSQRRWTAYGIRWSSNRSHCRVRLLSSPVLFKSARILTKVHNSAALFALFTTSLFFSHVHLNMYNTSTLERYAISGMQEREKAVMGGMYSIFQIRYVFFFFLDLRYRVLISLSVFVGNDELRLSSGIESGASWIPRGIFGGESLRVFFSMWDGT